MGCQSPTCSPILAVVVPLVAGRLSWPGLLAPEALALAGPCFSFQELPVCEGELR